MPDYAWHWSGYALAILASLFVLWSLFADRARGRKRCRKCWYDLASLGEVPTTCPECGKAHAKPKHLIRTRRRYRRAIIGLVFLIASYGFWTTPRVIERGWSGAVPTALLMIWPAVVVPSYADQSAMDLRDISHWSLIAESERRWAEMPLFQKRITIWCWRKTNAVKPGPDYTMAGLLFREDFRRGRLPRHVENQWLHNTLGVIGAPATKDLLYIENKKVELYSIPRDALLFGGEIDATVTASKGSTTVASGRLRQYYGEAGWYGRLALQTVEGDPYELDITYRDGEGSAIHAFRVSYELRQREHSANGLHTTLSSHVLFPVGIQRLDIEAP